MSTSVRSRGPIRARLALLLSTLLLLTVPLPAAAQVTPDEDPAEAAAGWLVSVLTDDPAVGTEFGPSAGLTIDVLFALAAVGVAGEELGSIADWLTTQAPSYTQGAGFDADDAAYAGASAKLALAMLVMDRDPRDVDGIDLIEQLSGLEITDPDAGIVGRFSDRGDFDDFSTPLTQSLALLALARAPDVTPSSEAVDALVDQACPDGGFPSRFAPETCTSSVDTTGFAVQALLAVGATDAAEAAASWLLDVQASDGSFSSPDGTNTNSTGLAAAALTASGQDDAAGAAQAWISDQQDGCDTDTPGAIPFNRSERGSVELATAQATFGLTGASLASVTAAGAAPDAPEVSCPAAEPEEPQEPEELEDPADNDTADAAPEEPVDAPAPADDVPQPTGVDAGLSPSSAPYEVPGLVLAVALLGAVLLLAGLAGSRRRRSATR
ncbi:MAG: peptidase [Nitriliruptoraceae bacterium]